MVLMLGAGTLSLCLRGARWERVHPDEQVIVRWLLGTRHTAYIGERVYPGGYFELMRLAQRAEEGLGRIHQHVERWLTPGRVRTARAEGVDHLLRARMWNAGFMAAAAMMVFGMAYRLLDNRLAAWLAAVWFGMHPLVVEHGHYAETDAMMLATQVLTLWLLAAALQEQRLRLALAGAVTAGLAFGSKYTLLPLLPLPPVAVWFLSGRQGRSRRARGGWVLAACLLVAAGFVWATPVIVDDFSFFVSGSRHIARRTYGEMAGLLGEMARVPGAARLWKTRAVLDAAAFSGWTAWLLALLALPRWLNRRWRSTWMVLPLFSLLFVVYVMVGLPWFRNQEFLPLLPVLAVTLVLPLADLMRSGGPGGAATGAAGRRRLVTAAQVVLFVVVIGQNAARGARMASAFGQHDTRTTLRDWLARCGPEDARIGYEPYTESVADRWNKQPVCTPKVERMPTEAFEAHQLVYQVCAPGMTGRGLRHPWTGARYATGAAHYATFTNRATLLRRASITPGIRPTFAQIDVELWGLPSGREDPPPAADISLELNRPILLASGEERLVAPAWDAGAGPGTGLRLSRRRGQVAFHVPSGGSGFAVALNTGGSRAAQVRWDRLMRPRAATLAPGSAVGFQTDGAQGRLTCWDVRPTAGVRLSRPDPDDSIVVLPAVSAAHAARLLIAGGAPGEALRLLAGVARERDLTAAEQTELVLALADYPALPVTDAAPLPPRHTVNASLRTARRELEHLDRALLPLAEGGLQEVSVNGIAIRLLDDFARLRLDALPASAPEGLGAATPGSHPPPGVALPCLLLPGRYLLQARVGGCPPPAPAGTGAPPAAALSALSLEGCRTEPLEPIRDAQDGALRLRCAVWVSQPVIPRLTLRTADGGHVRQALTEVELSWSTRDRLRECRERLADALQRLSGD
jgi:hypothetical protein